MSTSSHILTRIRDLDWSKISHDLNLQGWSQIPSLLQYPECDQVAALYSEDRNFRNRVVMSRHGYGSGEYRYFSYPLPELILSLRRAFYPDLAAIANAWNEALKLEFSFPENHQEFIQRCHAAGQTRPTPLLLQYGSGDYNRLHQDLYGEHLFPLQLAILLSKPGKDFEGGEFVLTEQQPRKQSRATVVPLDKGDAVVFAVNNRPMAGTRGYYRVKLRHGVSTIRCGHRHTLGIIFHDAL